MSREYFRNYLTIVIILLVGCIIGVLSVYIYESRVYKIIQITDLINPKAPSDYINKTQIEVYLDKFCVLVNNSRIVSYTPTGSMIPTLSENSNGIEIPVNQTNINIGDIVAYEGNDETHLIAHRVINKRVFNNTTQYLIKGDGNYLSDGWINESKIIWKTISVIY